MNIINRIFNHGKIKELTTARKTIATRLDYLVKRLEKANKELAYYNSVRYYNPSYLEILIVIDQINDLESRIKDVRKSLAEINHKIKLYM